MIRSFTKNTREQESSIIDTSKLDESFELLRLTSLEVSKEAVNAARALEKRLQESECRFNSTIDALCDLIIVKDSEGRWQRINRYGQILFGITESQYVNKTTNDLILEFPHLSQVLSTCDATDQAAWHKGLSYRYDETVEAANGVYHFDVVKTPIFNSDGTKKELITVGRDITLARERQRRTKACFTALNSASDMIVIVDNNFRVFFCNDRFVEYFHIDDYNNAVGEKLTDIVTEFPSRDMMMYEVENNHVWKANYNGEFNLTVMPMINGITKPIYYVLTFKEISRDKYMANIGDSLGAN